MPLVWDAHNASLPMSMIGLWPFKDKAKGVVRIFWHETATLESSCAEFVISHHTGSDAPLCLPPCGHASWIIGVA